VPQGDAVCRRPEERSAAARISRLIETLEILRDQCTAMISSNGSRKKR
jgi:hypothetical protein